MKNVTITLPDDLAHRAKVLAAQKNTSVSKYVGKLLADSIEAEEGYSDAMKKWTSRRPSVINESRRKYPSRDALHER